MKIEIKYQEDIIDLDFPNRYTRYDTNDKATILSSENQLEAGHISR